MSRIDEIFKDNLDNHGFKYDDSYWAEMEKMLDRKKRRKAVFFYSVLTSVFMCVAVGLLLFFNGSDTVQQTVDTKGISSQVPSDMKGNDVPTVSNEGSIQENQENQGKQEQITYNEVKHESKANPVIVEKGQKIDYNVQTHEPVKEKPIVAVESKPSEPVTNAFNLTGVAVQANAVNQNTDDILGIAPRGFLPMSKPEFNPEISAIAYEPFHPVKKTIPVTGGPAKDSSKINAKWQYFIAPGYEYDKYTRTAVDAPLKKDEQTMNTSGYNLNFIARKNNWGFKTGFGLLQLSEQTNYNIVNKSYSYDTSYRLLDSYYKQSSTGRWIALVKRDIDTTVTETSTVNNPDSKVTFSYLKIPLMASYEFRYRQLGIFLNAGINTSFLIQKKGNYTTFDGKNYNLVNVKESNDFSKVLFQTYTAGGINWHFSKNFSVYGGYGFSTSLNSMVKSYSQKPKINLLTFGLEIRL